MTLHQLPTGTYVTRAAFAFRGGKFRDKRDFASTAVLVQHPEGDLLIDAGFSSEVADHIKLLPRFVQSPFTQRGTVDEQLTAAGYDRSRLQGVVVTHSHWDHVSGVSDLSLPIWMNEGELQYAAKDSDGKVFREISPGHRIRHYDFPGPAYLGFPSSYDVYGDGSVVIALAGGHTTGSVIVFVTLPTGNRYAFIGDLAWQLDALRLRVDRPLMLRLLADTDPKLVRQGLLRMLALTDRMQIVPSHDVSAYDGIPLLTAH